MYCNEIPLNVYEKCMTRANGAKTSCLLVSMHILSLCVCACVRVGVWVTSHWPRTTGHPVSMLLENDGAKPARHAALHAKYVMKGMQPM